MIGMVHTILVFCGKHAAKIRTAYLLSFLRAICANAPIMLATYMIGALLSGRADEMLCVLLAIALLFFMGMNALLRNLSDRLQSATGYKVFAEKRMEFGEHLRRLPMGYFTEGNKGKISAILSQDMVFIEEMSMNVVADVVSDLCAQAILTIFLFALHPYLGLTALSVALLAFFISFFMVRSDKRSSLDRQNTIEEMTDAVIEYTDGLAVSRAFGRTGASAAELRQSMEDMTRANISYENRHMPFERWQHILYGIGMSAILAEAILLLSRGELALERFIGVMLFLFHLFSPLKHLFGLDTRFAIMKIALDRIQNVFEEKPLAEVVSDEECLREAPAEAEEAAKVPEVEFRNVCFSYDGGEEVLHDISFAAGRGELIALIGHSGSGKTTIANLLARFWDIGSGKILVRGVDIRRMSMSSLMEKISMVFQNVYLFEDTVYNNIAMGKDNVSYEDVVQAAKAARCYDFIMKLPYGFDTVIGEGGHSLSGGEAQRISIARCILKDAPIVILDEATASIDADNERSIQEAMTQLCKDKTTIVIAHRLHTVRNANKLILIDEGRIADSGTHEELLARSELYNRLIALQSADGRAAGRAVAGGEA